MLVADAQGSTRTALVGRVKIEARPLVRGRAAGLDGMQCCSVVLGAFYGVQCGAGRHKMAQGGACLVHTYPVSAAA